MPDRIVTLNDFIANARSHGFARPNRFQVKITLPTAVIDYINSLNGAAIEQQFSTSDRMRIRDILSSRVLTISCLATNLAGTNIDIEEVHEVGHGRKMPHGESHTDLDATFALSGDMIEKKLFDIWIKQIVHSKTKVINFYDNFIGTVDVDVLDMNDDIVFSQTYYEAYPYVVNPIQFSMDATNTTSALDVSFAFRHKENDAQDAYAGPTKSGIFKHIDDVRDVILGGTDLVSAKQVITKGLEILTKVKTKNFTNEQQQIFSILSNVLREHTGVSGKDLVTVVRVFESDVKRNGTLSSSDIDALSSVIDAIYQKIGNVV